MMATKPIEKVMWAMRIDIRPKVRSSTCRKKSSSETPSRISGMATGVSTRKGRQREARARCIAMPAMVPSTVAIVAGGECDEQRVGGGVQHLGVVDRFAYQRVVKPTHSALSSESLKEKITTTASGT